MTKPQAYETEVIDKLFLELSHVTQATTAKELALRARQAVLVEALPSIVAGALFDFMGYLTTSDERWTLSAADDAAPAVRAIQEWARKRDLLLNGANVTGWRAALAQQGEGK